MSAPAGAAPKDQSHAGNAEVDEDEESRERRKDLMRIFGTAGRQTTGEATSLGPQQQAVQPRPRRVLTRVFVRFTFVAPSDVVMGLPDPEGHSEGTNRAGVDDNDDILLQSIVEQNRSSKRRAKATSRRQSVRVGVGLDGLPEGGFRYYPKGRCDDVDVDVWKLSSVVLLQDLVRGTPRNLLRDACALYHATFPFRPEIGAVVAGIRSRRRRWRRKKAGGKRQRHESKIGVGMYDDEEVDDESPPAAAASTSASKKSKREKISGSGGRASAGVATSPLDPFQIVEDDPFAAESDDDSHAHAGEDGGVPSALAMSDRDDPMPPPSSFADSLRLTDAAGYVLPKTALDRPLRDFVRGEDVLHITLPPSLMRFVLPPPQLQQRLQLQLPPLAVPAPVPVPVPVVETPMSEISPLPPISQPQPQTQPQRTGKKRSRPTSPAVVVGVAVRKGAVSSLPSAAPARKRRKRAGSASGSAGTFHRLRRFVSDNFTGDDSSFNGDQKRFLREQYSMLSEAEKKKMQKLFVKKLRERQRKKARPVVVRKVKKGKKLPSQEKSQ